MRLLQVKEVTESCYDQIRTQRYKVTSVDNQDKTELRPDNSRTEKHKC